MSIEQLRPSNEPAREVWVVSDGQGNAEYVANHRQMANDHASEAAETLPGNGPYRLCKYVAKPFIRQPVAYRAVMNGSEYFTPHQHIANEWGKHYDITPLYAE